jgi:hypothetical protein
VQKTVRLKLRERLDRDPASFLGATLQSLPLDPRHLNHRHGAFDLPQVQRCGIALCEQAVFFLTGHGLDFRSLPSPPQLWQTAHRVGVYRRVPPLYVDSGPQSQLERLPVTAPTSVLSALAAALLFGASTPCAKALLAEGPPILLAGLLYLGSGIGLQHEHAFEWDGREPHARAPS